MGSPLIAVIGAGPGIGLAVVNRFAQEGFRCAVVCRPMEDLSVFEKVALGECLVVPADLADASAVDAALLEIQGRVGLPEVLVYNASRGERIPASRLAPETMVKDFQVNAGAALLSARWALPAMRSCRRGTILFTGGGLALDPKAEEASLSVGKSALRSLALCLAQELAPEGIHAATITVCGFVQCSSAFSPEHVAEAFWDLHDQPREVWQSEVVLRPSGANPSDLPKTVRLIR